MLNETLFRSLWQAQRLIAEWQTDHNEERPYTSLGGLMPNEFATRSYKGQNPNSLWL
ncbi:MAG: integrase core domain-containing protein [Pseudomonadota bacterium]